MLAGGALVLLLSDHGTGRSLLHGSVGMLPLFLEKGARLQFEMGAIRTEFITDFFIGRSGIILDRDEVVLFESGYDPVVALPDHQEIRAIIHSCHLITSLPEGCNRRCRRISCTCFMKCPGWTQGI